MGFNAGALLDAGGWLFYKQQQGRNGNPPNKAVVANCLYDK